MQGDYARIVANNFETFKSLEGSEHIATFSSQINFVEILNELNPVKVLDYGTGIGTFVPLVLNFSKGKVCAVEKNKFCSDLFRANAKRLFRDLSHRVELYSLLPQDDFDIVIIDDKISRHEIHVLLKSKFVRVIFIEGWRNKTVGHISKRLPFFGYSAEFVRGKSRLSEFHRLGKHGSTEEKSGSWFLLKRSNLFFGLLSWCRRLKRTKEITELFKELFYFVLLKINIRFRLIKLKNKLSRGR